jgi:transcriptional regulator with XRE-family HTH domain
MVRNQRGIKAKYVAEKLGISVTWYSQIENDKANISMEMAEKIANILGVSAGIFYENQLSETLNQQAATISA